ncbi:hypothetical protein TL16_g13387, partial [Triparma laevis f. inornata]
MFSEEFHTPPQSPARDLPKHHFVSTTSAQCEGSKTSTFSFKLSPTTSASASALPPFAGKKKKYKKKKCATASNDNAQSRALSLGRCKMGEVRSCEERTTTMRSEATTTRSEAMRPSTPSTPYPGLTYLLSSLNNITYPGYVTLKTFYSHLFLYLPSTSNLLSQITRRRDVTFKRYEELKRMGMWGMIGVFDE